MFSFDRRIIILVLFHIICETLRVESGFHKIPSNVVAVVGQWIKMTCWTDPGETSQWFLNNHGGHLLVYNGDVVSPKFTPRFKVDNSTENGQRDLTVESILMTDAGIYECVLLSKGAQDRSIPLSTTAQLIVLESEPRCSTNVSAEYGYVKEFDYVAFRCAVNYSGHWIPSMQWSKGRRAVDGATYVINSNISQGVQQLSSVITLQVDADFNVVLITCKIWFSEASMKVLYINATNVPNYLFNWNTTVNVHFGARNVTITPLKVKYEQGDVLSCTAVGNPSPSYAWKNKGTQQEIATGPYLTLKMTRMGANQHYSIECIAKNQVAGDFKLSSATVEVTLSDDGLFHITVAMGVVCAILLLIAIAIGREHIKGWFAKLTSHCGRGSNTEPDILPNAEGNQNGVAAIYELEPLGDHAAPAESVAYNGAVAINFDQNRWPDVNPEVPVYAEINKVHNCNKPQSAASPPSQELCVDSRLKKNEYVVSGSSSDITKNKSTAEMSIGLDGTVYAELKLDGDLCQSQSSGVQFQDPMFNKSDYASIDHTTEHPPPSPRD